MSQLMFETLPQILLQWRMFYILTHKEEESQGVEVNLKTLAFSLLLGVLHIAIEALMIYLEMRANKTGFLNSLLISFNGK